jgi:hypothetical protein
MLDFFGAFTPKIITQQGEQRAKLMERSSTAHCSLLTSPCPEPRPLTPDPQKIRIYPIAMFFDLWYILKSSVNACAFFIFGKKREPWKSRYRNSLTK